MAYGVVISMKYKQFDSPNRGTLIDVATGVTYEFTRPDDTPAGSVPKKWNVEKNDTVTYTLVGGVPTGVTLYKKYVAGRVPSGFPI